MGGEGMLQTSKLVANTAQRPDIHSTATTVAGGGGRSRSRSTNLLRSCVEGSTYSNAERGGSVVGGSLRGSDCVRGMKCTACWCAHGSSRGDAHSEAKVSNLPGKRAHRQKVRLRRNREEEQVT
jgi:hypothetical protein